MLQKLSACFLYRIGLIGGVMKIQLAFLGFGNVGRALAEMLVEKETVLRDIYGIEPVIVGISTGRRGRAIATDGLDVNAVLAALDKGDDLTFFNRGKSIQTTEAFIAQVPADVVFEATPTNPHDGQPALSYVEALLSRGIHVVTANKGPVAFGYKELTQLADKNGVGFFFKSTIVGGSPAVTLAREALPAAEISKIEGIFNSTTNYILRHMEDDGLSFAEALKGAQAIGVAETDPSLDIEGWDAAIKTAILANVFLGADLRPQDVEREGITAISDTQVKEAKAAGNCIRLLCVAEKLSDGGVKASVAPTIVPFTSMPGQVADTGGLVTFYIDTMGPQALLDAGQGPRGTAYGMLVDMINLLRGRAHLKV